MEVIFKFTKIGSYGVIQVLPLFTLVRLPRDSGIQEYSTKDWEYSVHFGWLFFIVSVCFGQYE